MATRAELQAELSINIGPFQKGLHQATEGVREFSKKTAEAGKDIAKELAGNDLSKLLGLAGATAAVSAFGLALVEAGKKGIEAFRDFEKVQLRIQQNLKDRSLGAGLTANIEETSGAAGSFAERGNAAAILLEAGIQPGRDIESSKEKPGIGGVPGATQDASGLITLPTQEKTKALDSGTQTILHALDEWSKRNGDTQSQMAETLRMMHAGGADSGEGMTRALRSFKGLDIALQPFVDAANRGHAGEQGYVPKTAADLLKSKQLNFQDILGAIVKSAPKDAVSEYAKTFQGHVRRIKRPIR